MIKFWLSILMFILCIIGIILLSVLLFDDYVAKSNLDKYHKKGGK